MLRSFSLVVLSTALVLTGCSESQKAEAPVAAEALDTDYKKLSYGLGLNIGGGINQQGVPGLHVESLLAGISAAVAGDEPRITQEELSEVVARIQQSETEKMQQLANANLEEGAAFLAENAKREGIITTESGLQYEVLTAGEGDSPVGDSIVKTHYHGTLIDGSVFDSSIEKGEPIEFAVNQVIPGWTEALQLMKVGDKWRLYVPASLGYGEYSPGPNIPPQSALIFEVELLGFKAPETLDDATEKTDES